jgi:hypothetical protein
MCQAYYFGCLHSFTLLPFPGIELRFLDRSSHSLVTILGCEVPGKDRRPSRNIKSHCPPVNIFCSGLFQLPFHSSFHSLTVVTLRPLKHRVIVSGAVICSVTRPGRIDRKKGNSHENSGQYKRDNSSQLQMQHILILFWGTGNVCKWGNLSLHPEGGGSMFHRNVGCSDNFYTVLSCPKLGQNRHSIRVKA